MARHLHLQPHLSVDELERRYRAAKEPHERSWWQILWLLAQGRTATELAGVMGYATYWIGQIAKRYNEQGPAGMQHLALSLFQSKHDRKSQQCQRLSHCL